MGTNALSDSGAVHANHTDIHHRAEGADGPWVVFAYALGVDHQLWGSAARHLASRYYALRYDTRGHSKTSASYGPYTLLQMADDMVGLLDMLSIGQVHFAGLSMDSMAGQVLGVWYARRPLSLTLCDTVCYTPASAHIMWDECIGQVEAHGMSGIVEPTIQRWLITLFRKAHPDVIKRIRGLLRAIQPHGYVGTCLAIKALDTRSTLTRIAYPTSVITGDQDTGALMEAARKIATHIPGTYLKMIPHAAHLVPIEQGEDFLVDLDEFLGHAGCGSQCDTP